MPRRRRGVSNDGDAGGNSWDTCPLPLPNEGFNQGIFGTSNYHGAVSPWQLHICCAHSVT